MLHKSFKPAKCKTSLKLATSRLKLMKNKKGVQMNQMKRELAQLLESGQDRTARIRVEHLIREEKMVAAYDLIEIYCELIAARLPIIDSQKSCPIDLKEAIASVVFASPRCADIPELLEVKKHFTAKYGKEFVTSALELRPNCGVGRMLVEKLSAIAPDGQTKVRVLTAIAEEHNIKWDATSLEEDSMPAEDLLNGPSSFQKASELHAETSKIQVSDVQGTSSHEKHVKPLNFTEESPSSTLNNQKLYSTDPGDKKATNSISSGKGDERNKVEHHFSGDEYEFSSSRQNWKMEFKDATSAAQAAAESAERASMAARAAAELSRGNFSGKYSSESHKSINSGVKHERPRTSAASIPGEHSADVPVNVSFHSRKYKLHNEQIDTDEHRNLARAGESFGNTQANTEKSSHSASLKSEKASTWDNTFVNRVQKPVGYFENSVPKETITAVKEPIQSRMDMKEQSVVDPRVEEHMSRMQDDFIYESVDQFEEARTEKQHRASSSHSHSSTNSDYYNVTSDFHDKFGNVTSEEPIGDNNQERIQADPTRMGSYDDSVAYDEYDFNDTGPKYDEPRERISSPGSRSPTLPTSTLDMWDPERNSIKSPERSISQPHFSVEPQSLFSVDPKESDDAPVIAYETDGPKFDSEDEQDKNSHGGTIGLSYFSPKVNVISFDPEPAQDENYESTVVEQRNSDSDSRSRFYYSTSSEFDNVRDHLKSRQTTVLNVESSNKFDSGESSSLSPQSSELKLETNSMGHKSSLTVDERNDRESSRITFTHEGKGDVYSVGSLDRLKDDELLDQPSTESESKLSFGTLRGGFRNKGYRYPPYNRKSPGDDASSLTQKAGVGSFTPIELPVASPSVQSSMTSSTSKEAGKTSSFRKSMAHSDSDSDSDADRLAEDVSQMPTSRRQAPSAQKSSKGANMKSSFRPPVATYFDLDDDNDGSKEDIPKQTLPNKVPLVSGVSRRTKASPPSTETTSYSKVQTGSEASIVAKINETKSTETHHGAEITNKIRFKTSDDVVNEDQPSLFVEKAGSKSVPESKTSSHEKNMNSPVEPSNPVRKARVSSKPEDSKPTGPTGPTAPTAEPPTREDSAKRASHVHPKLPDYDSIAARLQALRKDRN